MLSGMKLQELNLSKFLTKTITQDSPTVVEGAGNGDTTTNNSSLEDRAKTEAQNQLASRFPQTVSDKKYANSAYVNVTIDGKQFHVTATPKYIHNINEGTYSLQSVDYKVEEGNWNSVCPNDYANNIIENKAVGADTNINDLKNELSALREKIKTKLGELETLQNKISGSDEGFGIDSSLFEVDENSPDAASDLAKKIEEATKYLSELEIKVKTKQSEYLSKQNQIVDLKQQAKKNDEEYKNAMQLLDDLCKHYGVENNKSLKISNMVAPTSDDLDTLIEYYNNYISMQKENIANINTEIDKIKNSDGDDHSATNDTTDNGTLPTLDMEKVKRFMKTFASRELYKN